MVTAWTPIKECDYDEDYFYLLVRKGHHPDTNEPYWPMMARYVEDQGWLNADDPEEDMKGYRPTHFIKIPDNPAVVPF